MEGERARRALLGRIVVEPDRSRRAAGLANPGVIRASAESRHVLHRRPWWQLVLPVALMLLAHGCAAAAGEPANRDPHGPADIERHIRWLESDERLAFQKPDQVIAALGLPSSAIVADIGCGPGVFTRRLARVVSSGIVYAVDVEPRQLYRLQEHLAADGIENVVPVLANPDDPYLPRGRLDLVLVVDTYHHLERRAAYLGRLTRALAPGGRLVVIDYFKRDLPVGPPPDHKIDRETVVSEVEGAGYRLVAAPTFLSYQYFLIFAPPMKAGLAR